MLSRHAPEGAVGDLETRALRPRVERRTPKRRAMTERASRGDGFSRADYLDEERTILLEVFFPVMSTRNPDSALATIQRHLAAESEKRKSPCRTRAYGSARMSVECCPERGLRARSLRQSWSPPNSTCPMSESRCVAESRRSLDCRGKCRARRYRICVLAPVTRTLANRLKTRAEHYAERERHVHAGDPSSGDRCRTRSNVEVIFRRTGLFRPQRCSRT